ncbi:metal binding domain of Ada-domain-containing protein [Aspergillus ambiguus]|uniref:putative DNA repair and transcription factor Ada n=1 Tax=Aspergillus ambiguus TaxID=176160 RepID=UPI003CCCAF43
MAQKDLPQKIPRLTTGTTTSAQSAAVRWQAVVHRDATADCFVYAVLTTKIYCRPSCPSRLARRANIRFYDTPSQAEAAGFRPCKRCKPQTVQPENPQIQLIVQACATIESDIRAGSKPTLRELAAKASLTPSHFHRVFKRIAGVTPGQYAAAVLGRREGCGPVENAAASFQPWDGVDGSCDPGMSADLTTGWNDFDALIAAEADLASGLNGASFMDESIASLTGGDIPGATDGLDWDRFVEG